MKYFNKATIITIIWLGAIWCLLLFFSYRMQISDNWQEYPSITTKPWAAKVADSYH